MEALEESLARLHGEGEAIPSALCERVAGADAKAALPTLLSHMASCAAPEALAQVSSLAGRCLSRLRPAARPRELAEALGEATAVGLRRHGEALQRALEGAAAPGEAEACGWLRAPAALVEAHCDGVRRAGCALDAAEAYCIGRCFCDAISGAVDAEARVLRAAFPTEVSAGAAPAAPAVDPVAVAEGAGAAVCALCDLLAAAVVSEAFLLSQPVRVAYARWKVSDQDRRIDEARTAALEAPAGLRAELAGDRPFAARLGALCSAHAWADLAPDRGGAPTPNLGLGQSLGLDGWEERPAAVALCALLRPDFVAEVLRRGAEEPRPFQRGARGEWVAGAARLSPMSGEFLWRGAGRAAVALLREGDASYRLRGVALAEAAVSRVPLVDRVSALGAAGLGPGRPAAAPSGGWRWPEPWDAEEDARCEFEELLEVGDGAAPAFHEAGALAWSDAQLSAKRRRFEDRRRAGLEGAKESLSRRGASVDRWEELHARERRLARLPRRFSAESAAPEKLELCQLLLSAAVGLPLAAARRSAHRCAVGVLQRCDAASRWLLLRALLARCPFPSARALLMDLVRLNANALWGDARTPFYSPALVNLLAVRCRRMAERPRRACGEDRELTAATLALLRFVALRDGGALLGDWRHALRESVEGLREAAAEDARTAIALDMALEALAAGPPEGAGRAAA